MGINMQQVGLRVKLLHILTHLESTKHKIHKLEKRWIYIFFFLNDTEKSHNEILG